MKEQKKLEILEQFLRNNSLAAISTVTTDGLPQSAVIGFAGKENFELIFGTFASSRKVKNLKTNPRVALTIGWEKGITVQYEGVAEELSGEELEKCKKIFLQKTPSAAKYVSSVEERFFKIRPKWIRYSNWSRDPVEKFEVRF